MTGRIMAIMGVCLLMATGCATTRYPAPDDERGFVFLFDGETLDGWEIFSERPDSVRPDGFYVDDEGNLACAAYNWHWVRFTEPLADCVLRLEFKCADNTNSGVVLRSLKGDSVPPPPFTGFEVQIFDDTLDEPPVHSTGAIFDPLAISPTRHCTGAIYDMVTPMHQASKPIGEWNDLEIVVDNHIVIVTLNGWKLIDTDFSKFTERMNKFNFAYADMPREGYLALQDHGTPVWYRNIRVKKLN